MCKIKITAFLCAGALALTACGTKESAEVPQTTVNPEEYYGLYAEYASTVLMKYNAGTNMRILEGQHLLNEEAYEAKQKEQEDKRQQRIDEYQASLKNEAASEEQQANSEGSEDSAGEGTEHKDMYVSDLAEAMELSAFSVVYQGYDVKDSYPGNGEEALLTVEAGAGKKLFIAKFQVTNVSGQAAILDVFGMQPKFELTVDGERVEAQYTLMLDDLAMYRGSIEPGQSVDTVLLFEMEETLVSNAVNVELKTTLEDNIGRLTIKGAPDMAEYETSKEAPVVEPEEAGEESTGTVTVVGAGVASVSGNSTNPQEEDTTPDGAGKLEVSVEDYMEALETE